MAFDTLQLKNPNTGELKEAPVGFSWTVLFWGFFPPLFRGDWKFTAIFLLLGMFTFGASNLVFSFIYNKFFIKDLIYKEGFKVTGSKKGNLQLISNKLGLELPMLEG
jgi:hypothetical protein